MARIRTLRNKDDVAAIFEDPTPGSDYIFMQRDAYDKITLSPIYDKAISYNVAGTGVSDFGYSYGALNTQSSAVTNTILGGVLMLAGEVTHVRHPHNGTINNMGNNLDQSPWISMDPANRHYPVRYVTNGTDAEVIAGYNYHTWNGVDSGNSNQGDWRWVFVRWPDSGTRNIDILDRSPRQLANAGQETQIYPVYWNSQSGNLISAGYSPSNLTGGYFISQPHQGSRLTGLTVQGDIGYSISTRTNGHTTQFIGVGQNSHALIFWNANANDHTQTIYRYNDTTNTSTTLHTFNASPAAGGTSAGGNRGTNFGNTQNKMASMTFTTAAEPTIKKFYVPYLDVNGFYHPIYFTWNTANDTFTRATNITVNWGAGNNQSTYWSPDTVGGDVGSKGYGHQRAWYNEIFTFGGVRYLTFMQLHGAGGIWDLQPKMRTFVTFSIDDSTPTTLNFHSSVEIPFTPKNIVWLNDNHTIMGVFTHTAFYVYSFGAGGWTLIGTWNLQFNSVGRDSLGRIWAHESGQYGWGALHLITLNVPVTISITAPQNTYNFTGTTISTNFTVNTYNQAGQRIVSTVKLVIDGGSMLFSGNNLTTTVTTSSTADTTVPVSITAGGISNIIASVVL